MISRIWAFLTGQQVVYLEDSDGEVTKTFAKKTPFGTLIAKRYWPFSIHNVTLMPDGTTKNDDYVVRWTK